ncbi:hypothetical protein TWF694_002592 [Orbilia ellipsospora]|uniref:Uncharacterized protein n=1 Tax=Orbilia ellipsospora TaxID=2528407 RepID=A0AAV9X2R8_9PEZI
MNPRKTCFITPSPRRRKNQEAPKHRSRQMTQTNLQLSALDTEMSIIEFPSSDSGDETINHDTAIQINGNEVLAGVARHLNPAFAASEDHMSLFYEDVREIPSKSSRSNYESHFEFDEQILSFDFESASSDTSSVSLTRDPQASNETHIRLPSVQKVGSPQLREDNSNHVAQHRDIAKDLIGQTQTANSMPDNQLSGHLTDYEAALRTGFGDWISIVTELHLKLHNIYCEGTTDCQVPESEGGGHSSFTTRPKNEFAVDKIFILSQNLLDLYYQICGEPSHSGDLLYQRQLRAVTILQDPAALLLLFACRLKLMQIYQDLLEKIQSYFCGNSASWDISSVQVPNFNIGAFSLQYSPSIKIVVILQIVENFLKRIWEVTTMSKTLAHRLSDDVSTTPLAGVTDATLEAIKKNECEILKTIKGLKQTNNWN